MKSLDRFHVEGGLNIEKLKKIETIVEKYNLNVTVSTLFQDSAVAFGRAKNLNNKMLEKKQCLNKKESSTIPYFYTTVDGEVSTCAWKCAPVLGNCFNTSWNKIIENLNTPIQTAIIQSDILEVARLVSCGDEKMFKKYKNIIERCGQCVACREMFRGKYENSNSKQ